MVGNGADGATVINGRLSSMDSTAIDKISNDIAAIVDVRITITPRNSAATGNGDIVTVPYNPAIGVIGDRRITTTYGKRLRQPCFWQQESKACEPSSQC